MAAALEARTVSAADGTRLGLHSLGEGPDLVIVHGAMQSGASHRDLAELLSDRFRVHLFDRRGRGSSGDLAPRPSTAQEVSDLATVLDATGAGRVFGVSSGAVVAARAALADNRISRLALFEPPISVDGSIRLDSNAM